LKKPSSKTAPLQLHPVATQSLSRRLNPALGARSATNQPRFFCDFLINNLGSTLRRRDRPDIGLGIMYFSARFVTLGF